MTLQALRHRVGESAFWTILRTWVADREGGNGTTEEFQALAEQVSGEDLDGFFTAWLVTGERPAHTPENGF
jgi:aminopeptidase N